MHAPVGHAGARGEVNRPTRLQFIRVDRSSLLFTPHTRTYVYAAALYTSPFERAEFFETKYFFSPYTALYPQHSRYT